MTTAGWARGCVSFWARYPREGALGAKRVLVRVGFWRGSDWQHRWGPPGGARRSAAAEGKKPPQKLARYPVSGGARSRF
jgi:hypothetical protein